MSYWSKVPPTEKQQNAITQYNKAYGINIHVNTKQQAHDVISVYCPVQKLEFTEEVVKGTNVKFTIVDKDTFSNYKTFNHNRLKNVKSIEIKEGIATLGIAKKNNNNNVLKTLNDSMGKYSTKISYSEYEDSLGYLDEESLERERDMYGSDPLWWK